MAEPSTTPYGDGDNTQISFPAVNPPIPVGFWLVVVVLANVVLVTSNGYSGDIDYWVGWTKALQTHGFAGLDANYPPVFMYWLWLVGQLHSYLSIGVAPTSLLRFVVNTPVLVAHAALLLLVNAELGRVRRATAEAGNTNFILALVAVNPALLVDGPAWGQVDAIYCLFIALALYLLIRNLAVMWVLPLLTISVLTKFQTVCIAPVVLPLLWHRRSVSLLWSVLLSLLLAIALLTPYALAGNLTLMLQETYIKAASYYPNATLNALNLWYLLGLNDASYDALLYDSAQQAQGWSGVATPRVLGKVLFVALSLWALITSWRKDDPAVHWRNGLLVTMGFFLLLPAMHERYLMPAVVLSLVAAASMRRFLPHAVALTVVAALNILIILHPTSGAFPWLLSAASSLYLLAWLLPKRWLVRSWESITKWRSSVWLGLAAGIWCWGLYLYLKPLLPVDGWLDATQLVEREVTQEWGTLQIGLSVDRHRLSVNGHTYGRGFGTHAESSITLAVPERVTRFAAAVGVDDDARAGVVEFVVQLDGRSVWRSGVVAGGTAAIPVDLELGSSRKIGLLVHSLGTNQYDHADWLEPRFKLAP